MKTGNVTTVGQLWKLFNQFGFNVTVTDKGRPDERLSDVERTVCREKTPVVVLQRLTVNDTKYGHYRIVVGFDGDVVYTLDPIVGLVSYSRVDFIGLWRQNADVESDNVAIVPYPE